MNLKVSQSGQSISEFIVTMAVLAPLLLTMASFANLLSLSTETVEAGRLAAWQRTVYQPNAEFGFTNADALEKIEDNINGIYLSRNYTDYGPGKELDTSSLPSIVDRDADGGQPVSIRIPTSSVSGTGMATEYTRLSERLGFASGGGTSAALLSPEVSIAIDENYSLFKRVGFENFRQNNYEDMSTPDDLIAGRPQFNMSSHSAMIASSLYAASEEELDSRTGSAAFDGVYNSGDNSGGLGRFEADLLRGFRGAGFDEADLGLGEDGLSTSSGLGGVLPSDL
ncbi:MAG: hypothetical protein MI976_14650 [Pseudomonadales bacterium]|nr:hypothetical protein [Pseudomonadales bacterium]